MTGFRRLTALLLAALALCTGVTACASRPKSEPLPVPAEDPASAFPVEVTIPGQEPVTIPQQPKRIISLSPTATETLYAIGAGEQVSAVDQFSTHPEHAPRTPLSGLTADAAAVGAHNPDLVVVPDNAQQLAEGLRAIDVPVLLTPSAQTLDLAYQQIETIGKATGHTKQARALTGRMRSEIEQIVRNTPKPTRPLRYFHEISPDYYTATSQSFVGSIYGLFGMTSIADEAGGKFPQLSEESIVQADPDLIFLADGAAPESVAQRPGWDSLTAVQRNQVHALNGEIAGRWGPRVVDLAREISAAVARVR